MADFIGPVLTQIAIVAVVASSICLALRAWLIRSGQTADTLPLQSRLLVENSKLVIVADILVFAIIAAALERAFSGISYGVVFAILIATFLTPLQIRATCQKWFGGQRR